MHYSSFLTPKNDLYNFLYIIYFYSFVQQGTISLVAVGIHCLLIIAILSSTYLSSGHSLLVHPSDPLSSTRLSLACDDGQSLLVHSYDPLSPTRLSLACDDGQSLLVHSYDPLSSILTTLSLPLG